MVSSGAAFAALRHDATVVTWGFPRCGGASVHVQKELVGVSRVVAARYAFAALRTDGSVVTWGSMTSGGDSREVEGELVA